MAQQSSADHKECGIEASSGKYLQCDIFDGS
jgi:hypothetical protein